MKIKDILSIIGNGFMYILTVAQTKEIFQIISLVLSILISVVILIGKIVDWYRKAKADGKITKEEVEELVSFTKEDFQDLQDKIGGKK